MAMTAVSKASRTMDVKELVRQRMRRRGTHSLSNQRCNESCGRRATPLPPLYAAPVLCPFPTFRRSVRAAEDPRHRLRNSRAHFPHCRPSTILTVLCVLCVQHPLRLCHRHTLPLPSSLIRTSQSNKGDAVRQVAPMKPWFHIPIKISFPNPIRLEDHYRRATVVGVYRVERSVKTLVSQSDNRCHCGLGEDIMTERASRS